MNRPKIVLWITALFINLSLLVMYYGGNEPKRLVGDEVMYVNLANQFVQTGTFEVYPLWPPGYTYFMGTFAKLCQAVKFPFLLSLQIVQILFCLMTAWLFGGILEFLVKDERPRLIALGLFMLYPTLAAYSHYFWPETIHLFLCLFAIWVWMYKRKTAIWGVLLGGILGLVSLIKLVFLPFLLVLFITFWVRAFFQSKRFLFPIFATTTFALLILPISSNNYKKHGFFFPGNSSTINLWIGLNDSQKSEWGPEEIVGKEIFAFYHSAQSFSGRNAIYKQKIKDF
jgi:hypothetical protein